MRKGIGRIKGIFNGMRTRCYNSKAKDYQHYGGRGIKICDEWLNDIDAFCKWSMDNGYSDDLSIDRIDVNGDYCPCNCRWATSKEQGFNRRNNRNITINGVTKTLTQWAEESGLNKSVIWVRLAWGWPEDEKLLEHVECQTLTIDGITKTYIEWGKENNISPKTIRARVNYGWPDELLFIPVLPPGMKRKWMTWDL